MVNPVIIVQSDPEVPAGVFAQLLTQWHVPLCLLRADLDEPLPEAVSAAIVLGGAMGVHDNDRHPFLSALKTFMARQLADGTPLLGICLGGQLLADVAGGNVSSNRYGERGLTEIRLTAAGRADPLFAGIASPFHAFQWHNDSFALPSTATLLATSDTCPGQALRIGNAWGLQFHPEVDAAIVATWNSRSSAPINLQQFRREEETHRQMAQRLLANFLAVAKISPSDLPG